MIVNPLKGVGLAGLTEVSPLLGTIYDWGNGSILGGALPSSDSISTVLGTGKKVASEAVGAVLKDTLQKPDVRRELSSAGAEVVTSNTWILVAIGLALYYMFSPCRSGKCR